MPISGPTYKQVTGGTSAGGPRVTGPSSSTDRAIAVFNGTGGNDLLNTGITINASNNVSGMGTLACGAITTTGAFHLNSSGDANMTIQSGIASSSETTGEAQLTLLTKATDGGDPFILWSARAGNQWCVGIDASESLTKLVFGEGSRLSGGSPRVRIATGGDMELVTGQLKITAIQTSDPAVAGEIWSDAGTLKVSAG